MNSHSAKNNLPFAIIFLALVALGASIYTEYQQQQKQTLIKDTETSHCQIVKQGLLCKEVSERAWLETI